jgi:uncharacterized coiled-coil DUF342 family protein
LFILPYFQKLREYSAQLDGLRKERDAKHAEITQMEAEVADIKKQQAATTRELGI